MNKEEALKQYNDGLEKYMNHPALLNDRTLKDMMKYLCTTAFELGWELSTFDTKSKEEQEVILTKWREEREKIKSYDGFVLAATAKNNQ